MEIHTVTFTTKNGTPMTVRYIGRNAEADALELLDALRLGEMACKYRLEIEGVY